MVTMKCKVSASIHTPLAASARLAASFLTGSLVLATFMAQSATAQEIRVARQTQDSSQVARASGSPGNCAQEQSAKLGDDVNR